MLSHEYGFQADAFIGRGRLDTGEVTKRSQCIQKIDLAGRPGSGLDAGAFDDEGHSPAVFVKVLLALQAMPTDRDSVVGGVDDVGAFEFAHGVQFSQDSADLDIDIFTTGEFPAQLVTNGRLVAPGPYTAHPLLVSGAGKAEGEGMGGQVVGWEGWLFGIGAGRGGRVGVVDRPVLREKLRGSVACVVRMRKSEIDQERVLITSCHALVEIVHDLVTVPPAAGLVRAAALIGVASYLEQRVGRLVAVALLASTHSVVARSVEDRGQGVLEDVGRNLAWIIPVGIVVSPRAVGSVPQGATRHDHVARRRANAANPSSHVVGLVDDHTFGGQPVNVGRIQKGTRVIHLEVEWGLVVRDDEEEVGAFRFLGEPREDEGCQCENAEAGERVAGHY